MVPARKRVRIACLRLCAATLVCWVGSTAGRAAVLGQDVATAAARIAPALVSVPDSPAQTDRTVTDSAAAAASARDQAEAGGPTASTEQDPDKPFYKRAWFLAGTVGAIALAAVLLSTGGGAEDDTPAPVNPLPGFPPPPGSTAGATTRGPTR